MNYKFNKNYPLGIVQWKSTTNNVNNYSAKIRYGTNTKNQIGNINMSVPQPGRAGPLKIPRKQYPYHDHNIGNFGSISRLSYVGIVDKPNGYTATINNGNCNDCSFNNMLIDSLINKNQYINTNGHTISGECIKCSPVNNIIKSASTVIDKKKIYAYNTKQYLYKNNKTFEQNYSSQALSGDDCSCSRILHINHDKCKNTNINTYQSTTSSSRIARLKYNTISANKSTYCNGNTNLNTKKITANPRECQNNNFLHFRTSNKNECH